MFSVCCLRVVTGLSLVVPLALATAGWSGHHQAVLSVWTVRLPAWDGSSTEIAVAGQRVLYAARTAPPPRGWRPSLQLPGNEMRLYDVAQRHWSVVDRLSASEIGQGYGYQGVRLDGPWAVYVAGVFAEVGAWSLWLTDLRTGRHQLLDSSTREYGPSTQPSPAQPLTRAPASSGLRNAINPGHA